MRSMLTRTAALLLAGFLVLPAGARAEDEPPIRLELNRLEPRETNTCRVWFVVENGRKAEIDPLRLDLVLFGRDGVVVRRLAVDVGPVPAARKVVRLFDLAGQTCDQLGEVLLNDLLQCGSGDGRDCLDHIALTSRVGGVAFVK